MILCSLLRGNHIPSPLACPSGHQAKGQDEGMRFVIELERRILNRMEVLV